MIVGLLSDTHGDAAIAHAAARLLVARGAGFLIHCGDVGDESVLDALAGVPSAFVFGNNDDDHRRLEQYAADVGIECLGDGGTLTIDGVTVGVTHGDDRGQVERLLAADGGCAYVFTGHSHHVHDKRVGRVRWINPGALYRAAVKTCATLDVAKDTLDVLTVGPVPSPGTPGEG